MEAATLDPPQISADSITLAHGTWYTAQTKTGEEIRLASDLVHEGIATFLPLVQRNSIRFGHKTVIQKPLFANYLFFCGGLQERYAAIMTARTLSILMEPKQRQLVDDLESLRIAIKANPKLGEYKGIRSGAKCLVVHGPYRGATVRFEKRMKGDGRALVIIQSLGRAVELDVPEEFLEPI